MAYTQPVGTTRSLNLLRRSNASMLTLAGLDRPVTPEPRVDEDAYTSFVRQEAQKERNMTSSQKAFRHWRTFRTEMKIKAKVYRNKLEVLKARRA